MTSHYGEDSANNASLTLIRTGRIGSDAFLSTFECEVGRRSTGELLGRLTIRLLQVFVLGTSGILTSAGEDEIWC